MNSQCFNCGQDQWQPLYRAPAFDAQDGLEDNLEHDRASGQYGIARCQNCKLVNTTDLNPAAVAETYTPEYYGSAEQKFTTLIEKTVAMGNRARARKFTRQWRRGEAHKQQPQVLDIGCGRGQLLRAFKSAGASVLGLEREEFPGDACEDRSFIETGALSDHRYADRKFDIIILWHVFEHLEKHEELLRCISEHLEDDGLLVIAVPNFSGLQQRLFSKHWFHLDLPRHLVHLEGAWLQEKLEHCGFSIEARSYMDPLQNTYGFIQSAMNTLAPAKPNAYYSLLKRGGTHSAGSLLALLAWTLLAIPLAPVAIFDSLLGSLLGQGATIEIAARQGSTP